MLSKLSNGLKFNYRCSNEEPQRGSLKLSVLGGRLSESKEIHQLNNNNNNNEQSIRYSHFNKQSNIESNNNDINNKHHRQHNHRRQYNIPFGALMLAAKTMQEGGSLGNLTRTQVELFCVDQLIMVEMNANDEFLDFNFNFPTVKVSILSSLTVYCSSLFSIFL